jgi:RNA polymerase sigma factor (sigma-70 family)
VLLEQAEQQRLLRGCIATLPEEKREVLRLVYDAQMEVREVAAELSIPEGTVKSHLHNARKQLAQQWRQIDLDG